MDMPGHGGHGDHGGGGGGGGGESRPMCAMNMAFNWSTENVCVLFDFWRVNSSTSLVLTCAAVFLLGYFYEYARAAVRIWEKSNAPSGTLVTTGPSTPLVNTGAICNGIRWRRALFYGLLVAYSYSLMLIFMTYNGFLILAVIGGAIAGHCAYSSDDWGAVRGANCH
ncbi:copper transpport protein [Coemansia thaxteri]|uniref:Copper transport protein n=1 Tax=Coemansia thaxteri TaxID=2663907 RepID=A0A9W8BBB4_9FUNG|nr:copper transpport protein [Coemansia thaxteri]KAJ2009904.1 copper transpport protein [Coemansia thaxteri]KAJ2474311.1 copper transpport protein [Coemansia sp. RSA 2322]KAJ2484187.1 copper transpport protein [Coemansia sp. RSA 2320]